MLSILCQLTSILNRNCIFKDIRGECTCSRRRTRRPAYCMHNMLLIHINSDENSILRNRCCCGGTCGIVSHGASQSYTGEASDVELAERVDGGRRAGHRTSAIAGKFHPFKAIFSVPNARRNKSKATCHGTKARPSERRSAARVNPRRENSKV